MPRLLLWTVLLSATISSLAAVARAQTPVSLISIVLEKRTGAGVQRVDPRHVFDRGDTVRFQLRPQVDGFLYVLDLNTSGKYDVLFPRAETGNDNRIEHGHDYLLPATTDGWFRVAGPAGHERLYFVLSPVALTATPAQQNAVPLPPQGTAPLTMKPRCNDSIFRARGECVDANAGPQTVAPGETLPDALGRFAQGTSRDLQFARSGRASVVKTPEPLSGPVVYEFLLAHR